MSKAEKKIKRNRKKIIYYKMGFDHRKVNYSFYYYYFELTSLLKELAIKLCLVNNK